MGFFDKLTNAFDGLYKSIFGKNVVILGQRATGKTTLLRFLQTGEMTLQHQATTGVSKIKQTKEGKKRLKDLNWSVKLAKIQKDYAGTTGDYSAWKEAAREADLFIYLFNISEWVENRETVEIQLSKDIDELSSVLDGNKDVQIFIIGTHLDKLGARNLYASYEDRCKFIDDLQNILFFKGLRESLGSGQRSVHCHIGSLNTHKEMAETINYIIGRLK